MADVGGVSGPDSGQPQEQSETEDVHMEDNGDDSASSLEDERRDEDAFDEDGLPIVRGKITILPGGVPDLSACTFCLVNEDHTLGNALRYILMKNPDVELCAYSIPHPSENKVNIRIQMYRHLSAVDALYKGLEHLEELCGAVLEAYQHSLDNDHYVHLGEEGDPLEGILDELKKAKFGKGEEVDQNELKTMVDMASGRTAVDTQANIPGPQRKDKRRSRA